MPTMPDEPCAISVQPVRDAMVKALRAGHDRERDVNRNVWMTKIDKDRAVAYAVVAEFLRLVGSPGLAKQVLEAECP